jgi:hypothetical protein
MNTNEQLHKCNNTIIELSKMLSDRFWSDDSIKDRFILAALADGIHSAAIELEDLANSLPSPDENGPQAPD